MILGHTYTQYRDSCCFDFVACMCVCVAEFISLGLENFPSGLGLCHPGYIAPATIAWLILVTARVHWESWRDKEPHSYFPTCWLGFCYSFLRLCVCVCIYIYISIYIYIFLDFFFCGGGGRWQPHLWYVEVPGPGIKSATQACCTRSLTCHTAR